jgi:transposase-like protein
MPLPTIEELKSIFFDEANAKRYLTDKHIIPLEIECMICHQLVGLSVDRECYRHRCLDRQVEQSMWKSTYFEEVRLRPNKVLLAGLLWLNNANHTMLCSLTGVARQTATNLINSFNRLVAHDLTEEACRVGGPGIVVEVDESKLARRLNNRGHRVNGAWVIGGVERTPERKLFVTRVQNRNAETLQAAISSHVVEGSIVHTDGWRGYSFLNNDNRYEHRVVNHSNTFVSPDGTHTNTIEGTWSALKRRVPYRNRTESNLDCHVFKFIWMRQYSTHLWDAFLNALARLSQN